MAVPGAAAAVSAERQIMPVRLYSERVEGLALIPLTSLTVYMDIQTGAAAAIFASRPTAKRCKKTARAVRAAPKLAG